MDKYMGFFKNGCRAFFALAMVICFNASEAFAQGWNPGGGGATGTASTCLLNGTEFETYEKLCNPSLPNDSTGWFAKKPDWEKGCGETQMSPKNSIQTGMPGVLDTPSDYFLGGTVWTKVKSQNSPIDGYKNGFTAVVRNPKTIDPILSEGNGTNMLVNAGTSGDNLSHFLSYSFSGLKPNAYVTLKMDVYYLLDEESIEVYCENGKLNDYQPFGSGAHYNNGKLTMNPTKLLAATTKKDASNFGTKQSKTINAVSGAQSVTLMGMLMNMVILLFIS